MYINRICAGLCFLPFFSSQFILKHGNLSAAWCCPYSRIFSEKVAEMPLIGTTFNYRRKGMCRLFMTNLEKVIRWGFILQHYILIVFELVLFSVNHKVYE